MPTHGREVQRYQAVLTHADCKGRRWRSLQKRSHHGSIAKRCHQVYR
jgi:hypothetical protein